jgi:Patatin-like phospholipase
MRHRTRDEHLFEEGPKRILALDGGGVRGALTLSYLESIEAVLRARHGDDPDFRLCDYFDLIGGTSTGSIIATGLSVGYSVEELQDLYRTLAIEVFERPFWRVGVFVPKYQAKRLRSLLDEHFGGIALGSEAVRTGLMVMTKRLDTGSPWPLHNNPRGRYFRRRPGDSAAANGEFELSQIVRASTAAPHYFDPEEILVADGVAGAFVDGGVSTANNPALQLLLLATQKGFALDWPTGPDRLLVVSCGTGELPKHLDADDTMDANPLVHAVRCLAALMGDADELNQTVLQWLGTSPQPWIVDGELGDQAGDVPAGGPLLTYLRFQVKLDGPWLADTLGYEIGDAVLRKLQGMDDPTAVPHLMELGDRAALEQVRPDLFPSVFDVR